MSASLPSPPRPEANSPFSALTNKYPLPICILKFLWVILLLYISISAAGAINKGERKAETTVNKALSEKPAAILAIVLVVHGAIIIKSAQSARSICHVFIDDPFIWESGKIFTTTSFLEREENVSG